jgi:hypothetical protein
MSKAKPTTHQLPKPDDPSLEDVLKAVGGSKEETFNTGLLNQVTSTLWLAHSDKDTQIERFVAAALPMIAAKPRDEFEGMLAAQMVAAHAAAMECYRRAMIPEPTFAGHDSNLRHAAKLSRVYADLLLALDKHRGKRQQRVIVEHVHVHQGGQAIVGAVHQGGGEVAEGGRERPAEEAALGASARLGAFGLPAPFRPSRKSSRSLFSQKALWPTIGVSMEAPSKVLPVGTSAGAIRGTTTDTTTAATPVVLTVVAVLVHAGESAGVARLGCEPSGSSLSAVPQR